MNEASFGVSFSVNFFFIFTGLSGDIVLGGTSRLSGFVCLVVGVHEFRPTSVFVHSPREERPSLLSNVPLKNLNN